MQIYIKGKKIDLNNRNFIASGGEGSIYAYQKEAIKIYANPKEAIPEGKIRELSLLNKPNIITPKEAVRDSQNNVIGYTMSLISNSVPLCRLFTPAFKRDHNVSPSDVLRLVIQFRQDLEYVHNANILVVDINEMNYLLPNNLKTLHWIDTDSYQTQHYPATALMDSIKDWHANNKWTKNSDWFSWGIITFQMFSGLHPYRGKHSSVKDFTERMQQNISVFNTEVKIPKKFNYQNTIPDVFKKWYEAVFERGERIPPPISASTVININHNNPVISSTKLSIKELASFPDPIRTVAYDRNKLKTVIITTNDEKYIIRNNRVVKLPEIIGQYVASFSPNIEYFIATTGSHYYKEGGTIIRLIYIAGQEIKQKASDVMEYGTTLYQGVAIQSMLGSYIATIFPTDNTKYDVQLKGLEKYKIVEAKFERGVLIVIAEQKGKYDRFIFRFNKTYQIKHTWISQDIIYSGINFAVLDTGVCAHLDESDKLHLFPVSPIDSQKTIKDPVLNGDMQLYSDFNTLLVSQGKVLYSLKTK